MIYGHLQDDYLYTGISSGSSARYRVWEAFTFTFSVLVHNERINIQKERQLYTLYLLLARISESNDHRLVR